MKYEIVRKAKGRESVVAEGSLPKMNSRIKELRQGTRGGVTGRRHRGYSVSFELRPKKGD
jgi:hypothetical protein